MTFVCFLTRPAPGRPVVYTAEWVNRLWAGLRRHRTGELRLVCFTDGDGEGMWPEVDVRPVPDPAATTWWHRMALFRPDVGRAIADGRPFTNIDLDTVIVGNVDWIGNVPASLVAARDWGHSDRMNGGLWTLTPGHHEDVWAAFDRDRDGIQRRWATDDSWMGSLYLEPEFYQDYYPGKIWSYKRGHFGERKTPLEECPAGASLISFHGKPKPSGLPTDHWARRAWEQAA